MASLLQISFDPREQVHSFRAKLPILDVLRDLQGENCFNSSAIHTGLDLAKAFEKAGITHQFIIKVKELDGEATYIHPSCVYGGSCSTLEELTVRHPLIAARVAG